MSAQKITPELDRTISFLLSTQQMVRELNELMAAHLAAHKGEKKNVR